MSSRSFLLTWITRKKIPGPRPIAAPSNQKSYEINSSSNSAPIFKVWMEDTSKKGMLCNTPKMSAASFPSSIQKEGALEISRKWATPGTMKANMTSVAKFFTFLAHTYDTNIKSVPNIEDPYKPKLPTMVA